MSKTVVSNKGQVVIPKEARDTLGLVPGTVLKVQVKGKRLTFEPLQEPPAEVFIEAGSKLTEPILREAKAKGDKVKRLVLDLGVSVD
jgi:AbrB family looped-hinge helix DNA binding protein